MVMAGPEPKLNMYTNKRGIVLALLVASVFPSRPARAQDEGGEKPQPPARLPLRKGNPFIDKRLQTVPGRLPAVLPSTPSPAPAEPAAPPPVEATPPATPQPAKIKTNVPKEDEASKPIAPGDIVIPSSGDIKTPRGQLCKPLKPDTKVMLDFKGMIEELVATISKMTCKNFILTSKVKSQKFEIVSPTPITVEEAWRAFLSALEANEFTIIRVGRYHKIIQATDATRAPVPIYDDDETMPITDAMVTKIWKLKYASDINAVVNYLNIFKSGKGQIHPFQATNTIIGTDFGTSMERIERILKEIDQPGALEQVHVVPVEFASATEIAEKLSQVFEPAKTGQPKNPNQPRVRIPPITPGPNAEGGSPRPPPEGGGAPANGKEGEDEEVAVSKILADDRTNKLIIIASDHSFNQIMALKKELDIPASETSDSQIQVVHLRHADAEELASTLSALAQGRPTAHKAGAAAPHTGTAPVAPGAPPTGGSLFQGEVKITANKATNSLIITAGKSDFASLKRVIDKLDVARFQVFVEAVIMEIGVKRDRTLGLTWHAGVAPTIDGKQSPIIFGNEPTKDFNSLLFATNPLSVASLLGFATAIRGPTLPGTETIINGGIPALGVAIQALQTSNNVNVISSPHLLTLDNEEAEIQVNEKRPFPSGLALGGLGALAGLAGGAGATPGANPLGNIGGLGLGSLSFNREDVGLTLKLKPQIHDEEFVRLQIDQELSDVAGQDAVTGQTITSKRKVKSVVVVRSQDSVVIGGLTKDRQSVDESKVPLFGDLPLIGWLFKRQVKSTDKINLILVLTPYIIRGPNDFRQVFERKMKERKEFADQFYGMTEEYRAQIDWSRKRGPIANYRLAMRKELLKAENEGPGVDDETVIRPDHKKKRRGLPSPEEQLPPTTTPAPPSKTEPSPTPLIPEPGPSPAEPPPTRPIKTDDNKNL
jgi:general secretion pathway protein D